MTADFVINNLAANYGIKKFAILVEDDIWTKYIEQIWTDILTEHPDTEVVFSGTFSSQTKDFGVLSNPYLLEKAECTEYNLSCTIENGVWSYEEDTIMTMAATGGVLHHTDKNTLKKVK